MAQMTIELEVLVEGFEPYLVVADQRDFARWEAQPFGGPISSFASAPSLMCLRFLAWSASFRQQRTLAQWDEFDAALVEAMPAGDDDEDGDGGDVPPGHAAPSAAST